MNILVDITYAIVDHQIRFQNLNLGDALDEYNGRKAKTRLQQRTLAWRGRW